MPPFVLLAALAGGYIWFLCEIARPPGDTTTRTDVIVVLTGGGGRIAAGVALLQNGLAKQLFISGVNPTVKNGEIEDLHHQDAALSQCCIIVGHLATDTIGNASETAAFMNEKHYKSVRLVTADYHMPRALADFRLILPGTIIIPNPVHPAARPEKQTFLFVEYMKFLAAKLRCELIILQRAML